MLDMELTFNSRDVDLAIDKMLIALSLEGLSAFLGGVMGPYLQKRASDRFKEERDPEGKKWAPLAEPTVAIREAGPWPVGGEHPINRRSGELEEWVTNGNYVPYGHNLGASMRYPSKPPSGTLKDKVQTAQQGTDSPRTPPRPVIGVNEEDMMFFVAAFATTIEEALR